MVRPSLPYFKHQWRHNPATALYHVVFLVVIVIGLLMITGTINTIVSQIDSETSKNAAVAHHVKRSASIVVDPAIPLSRVADPALEEWISSLLSGQVAASREEFAARGPPIGPREERPDTANAFAAAPGARKSMIYVEVLGESEASRLTAENMLKEDHEPVPKQNNRLPWDLPVPSQLLRQMNSLELKKGDAGAAAKMNAGNNANNMHNIADPSLQNEYVLRPKYSDLPDHVAANIREKMGASLVRQEGDPKSFLADSNTAAPQKHRANVMIIAAMRTGSSFLGELFQQRQDFFYMFEPGMLLMHTLDSLNLTRRVMVTELIEMFNSFYGCKFNHMKFFVDTLNQGTLHSRKQVVPALVTSQFCRREKIKAHARPNDKCEPVTEQLLETACTTRAHTAIKTIRILDINLMLSAVRDVNLKLIHLVRDPRSFIVSRLRVVFPDVAVFNTSHLSSTYRNIVTKYCYNWMQNYAVGHYSPSLATSNYLLVRYEDIALEPYDMAGKIYQFVGVGGEIPTTVRTWLEVNTNTNDASKKRSAAFSTKRDSKSVLLGWKKRVTLDFVHTVENTGDCKQLMKVTGYRLVENKVELLKSPDDNLVAPLPKPEHDIADFRFF